MIARVPERCLIVFLMMEVDGFPQVVGVVFASAWAFRGGSEVPSSRMWVGWESKEGKVIQVVS